MKKSWRHSLLAGVLLLQQGYQSQNTAWEKDVGVSEQGISPLSLSIQQLILGLSYTSVYTSPTTEAGSCHFIHLGPDKETQSVTHWDKIGAGASITVKYWVKLYEITMFFLFCNPMWFPTKHLLFSFKYQYTAMTSIKVIFLKSYFEKSQTLEMLCL